MSGRESVLPRWKKKIPFSQEKGQSVGRIGFKSQALSCDNEIHFQFLF